MRSFCVNRNRNSIPVLVYKPGQSWFTLVLCWFTVAGTRQLVENRSAIQLQTSGLGAFFFFFFFFYAGASTFSFISLSSFVFSSENNLLGARFHRSTTAATESTANSSSYLSVPHLSQHFPFEKDACQNSSSSPFPDGIHEDKFED